MSMRRSLLFAMLAIIGLIASICDPRTSMSDYAICSPCGTGSMKPTLIGHKNPLLTDRIIWCKTAYKSTAPRRGDIVIISSNAFSIEAPVMYIKRIAAMPLESVRIAPPYLVVNGAVVTGPPIIRVNGYKHYRYISYELPDTNLLKSIMFHGSDDELKLGSNEYCLLGDNGIKSYDSRYAGPVQRSNILGKATAIIWPPYRIRNL